MGWVIAAVVVVVVGVIVAAIMTQAKRDQAARDEVYAKVAKRTEECYDRLGAPVFEELPEEGAKHMPLSDPERGLLVWCITPYGVMQGNIKTVGPTAAVVEAGDYTISIKRVENYFSAAMAEKMGVRKSAWIVGDIKMTIWDRTYVEGMGRRQGHRATIKQAESSRWVRNHTFFGDFLEIMAEELWFELMFGGFLEPIEYYEGLEECRQGEEVVNWTSEEERQYAESEAIVAEAMESIDESQANNPPTYDPTTTTAMFPDSPPSATPEPAFEPPEEPKRDYSPPAPEPSSGGGWFSGGDSGGSDSGGGGGDCGGCDD